MTKIDAGENEITLSGLLSKLSSGNESVLIEQGQRIVAELRAEGDTCFASCHSTHENAKREEVSAEVYVYQTEGETLSKLGAR